MSVLVYGLGLGLGNRESLGYTLVFDNGLELAYVLGYGLVLAYGLGLEYVLG